MAACDGTLRTISRTHAEWAVIALLLLVVGLVFQQAATDMAEQGIASGGPYDNAAAYPKLVGAVLGLLIAVQAAVQLLRKTTEAGLPLARLARPAAVVGVFALYLAGLGLLGYLAATPLMLAGLMWICGLRRPLTVALIALGLTLGLAFLFEGWLRIVLPGGALNLNIGW